MSTDEDRRPPNILLIVWDACRYDYALKHAPFLDELASSNIWFENAIAPSPWSLPSHASMFSGELPHEHGRGRFTDSIDTPLVKELSEKGYRTYGVSANGFASQRTGFHKNFDEFRYTGGRDLFVDGMDVSGRSQEILRDNDATQTDALKHILKQIPSHPHRGKSIANPVGVGCGELAAKFEQLQSIPHPLFAPTSDYSYTPRKNTRVISSILDKHERDDPFFLFTNYMDTHRCYKPEKELQHKHIGRSLEFKELIRLNEEVAAPWEFESKKARGALVQQDIEDIRGLYAGEVETVDRHLKELYETLDSRGLLEETLIIVTADHGENLGERDEFNRRRMGHEASVSDAVLRVPLLVSHPNLNTESIQSEVSLTALYDFCLAASDPSPDFVSTVQDALLDGHAVSQYPATGGGEETLRKYPEVPDEIIEHRSSEHSIVVYQDGLKVVAESNGERWAFRQGKHIDQSEVPDSLVSLTESHLNELSKQAQEAISPEQVSQLESLGYI